MSGNNDSLFLVFFSEKSFCLFIHIYIYIFQFQTVGFQDADSSHESSSRADGPSRGVSTGQLRTARDSETVTVRSKSQKKKKREKFPSVRKHSPVEHPMWVSQLGERRGFKKTPQYTEPAQNVPTAPYKCREVSGENKHASEDLKARVLVVNSSSSSSSSLFFSCTQRVRCCLSVLLHEISCCSFIQRGGTGGGGKEGGGGRDGTA